MFARVFLPPKKKKGLRSYKKGEKTGSKKYDRDMSFPQSLALKKPEPDRKNQTLKPPRRVKSKNLNLEAGAKRQTQGGLAFKTSFFIGFQLCFYSFVNPG